MAFMGLKYWDGRAHDLGRLTLGGLARNYFTYPAIMTYMSVAGFCLFYAFSNSTDMRMLGLSALAAAVAYPLIWYSLHRWVLHGHLLYKIPYTAKTWKRIHFDHHQDPLDLRVLFGALHTTLPTILIGTFPVGYLIGGMPGAAMATAVGMLITCYYEFIHCIQHLNHAPDWKVIQRMKQLHVAHHFHSEKGNYGITNYAWDRILGTFYTNAKDQPKSPTVFNLGYTMEEAKKYPWVLEASNGELRDDGPRGLSKDAIRKQAASETPAEA